MGLFHIETGKKVLRGGRGGRWRRAKKVAFDMIAGTNPARQKIVFGLVLTTLRLIYARYSLSLKLT